MKQLALCLMIAAAMSGCASVSGRYASLQDKASKAKTLQELAKTYRPTEVWAGQKVDVWFDESDDVLSANGYLSYYKIFSFYMDAGRTYRLTVMSFELPRSAWLIPVPAAYMIDREGALISGGPKNIHPKTLDVMTVNGLEGLPLYGLVGEWTVVSEKNGWHHLVLAADNSRPGVRVFDGVASPTGQMVFRIDK